MTDATFQYSEARFGELIGLSREKIRESRDQLVPDREWKKLRGQVMLTADAIWLICALYGVQVPDLEQCKPQAPEQGTNGEHEARKKMRVVQPMPINPRIVYAEELGENGDGNHVKMIVWVGDHKNFCFGDEIEVEPHEVQTGILQCVSPIPRDRRRVRNGA